MPEQSSRGGHTPWSEVKNERRNRKLDLNTLAKRIVEESTGDAPKDPGPPKDPAAVSLGRRGGLKGGRARADKLTPERRSEIAKKAAAARWSDSKKTN